MRLIDGYVRKQIRLNGFGTALLTVILLLVMPERPRADESADLWAALADGGHVAILRHALAPGIGDPANFTLGDCSTQRNLNDIGRDQARRTGQAFRDNNVRIGRVLSSQWCRCLETAELMNLGTVEPLPALNSFFATPERGAERIAALKGFIRTLDRSGPSVAMVTHQVSISRLTGEYTAPGEIVVLKVLESGNFEVVGAIPAL